MTVGDAEFARATVRSAAPRYSERSMPPGT